MYSFDFELCNKGLYLMLNYCKTMYLPVPKFLKLPKVHTVWRNKDIGDQFSHMEADNTFGT